MCQRAWIFFTIDLSLISIKNSGFIPKVLTNDIQIITFLSLQKFVHFGKRRTLNAEIGEKS